MTNIHQVSSLGKIQRIVLLLVALSLTLFLIFARGGFNTQSPLDSLARKSLDPDFALQNGRPTIFEFYADWCEACREMAPTMVSIENDYANIVDIVLLNVDNSSWSDFVDEYKVNGIPQLNFFNNEGDLLGKSIGVRSESELNKIVKALSDNKPLPLINGLSLEENSLAKFSLIKETSEELNIAIKPMSHSKYS